MTLQSEIVLKNIKPAKRYSKALIEASKESGDLDVVKNELEDVVNTLKNNPDLKEFINSPVVSKTDKIEVIKEIFENKNTHIMNFLYTLIESNRFLLINEIYENYKNELNKINNILNVSITSVIELDNDLKSKLTAKLEEKINKKIVPHFYQNDEIIGGLIIKIEDTVIDLSVKSKIENLKRK